MAGKKVVALLVVCIVFFAAVEVPKASATNSVDFAQCFQDCDAQCKGQGMGQTFCEMKCDTDCFNKEFAARLQRAHAP